MDGDRESTITFSVDDSMSDDAFDGLDDYLVTVTTVDDSTSMAEHVQMLLNTREGNSVTNPDFGLPDLTDMLDRVNADAVTETLRTGQGCYYSRSRQTLWRKGESSGQTQALVDFRIDCDGDTVLLQVDQLGVACHTGRRNCFFNAIRDDGIAVIAEIEADPNKLYKK